MRQHNDRVKQPLRGLAVVVTGQAWRLEAIREESSSRLWIATADAKKALAQKGPSTHDGAAENALMCAPSMGLAPGHDRDGRNCILGRSLDDFVADGDIDQRVSLLIDHAEDIRVFEEDRRVLCIDLLIIGQLIDLSGDRADLPARNGKAAWIFGKAERPAQAAGARLADVAGDARHLRVVEDAYAYFVVLSDETERRADAREIVRQCGRGARTCKDGGKDRSKRDFHRTLISVCVGAKMVTDTLDRPAFNRTRLKAEKSIGSRVSEQPASKRTQVALDATFPRAASARAKRYAAAFG